MAAAVAVDASLLSEQVAAKLRRSLTAAPLHRLTASSSSASSTGSSSSSNGSSSSSSNGSSGRYANSSLKGMNSSSGIGGGGGVQKSFGKTVRLMVHVDKSDAPARCYDAQDSTSTSSATSSSSSSVVPTLPLLSSLGKGKLLVLPRTPLSPEKEVEAGHDDEDQFSISPIITTIRSKFNLSAKYNALRLVAATNAISAGAGAGAGSSGKNAKSFTSTRGKKSSSSKSGSQNEVVAATVAGGGGGGGEEEEDAYIMENGRTANHSRSSATTSSSSKANACNNTTTGTSITSSLSMYDAADPTILSEQYMFWLMNNAKRLEQPRKKEHHIGTVTIHLDENNHVLGFYGVDVPVSADISNEDDGSNK